METLKEFYKIGNGPSSSHTMGPQKAAFRFREELEEELKEDVIYRVELYGSLAATGKGHLTDYIIKETLTNNEKNNVEILFFPETVYDYHTNGMKISAYSKKDREYKNPLKEKLYFSIGGGSIIEKSIDFGIHEIPKERVENRKDVYPQKNFQEILDYCEKEKITLPQYVERYEGSEIWNYLRKIWQTMEETIKKGLSEEGYLPGKLKLERKSKNFYKKFKSAPFKDSKGRIYSYALAASEENASAGRVVTAPTCGASGIIPAILKTYQRESDLSEEEVLNALAVAGVIGNIYKQNGSISGAEVGCQGEIGVACSMGAGMVAYILGSDIYGIEYAAEIAMEHCLGMTCDPMLGYVQIPCIERNAIYASKAIDCAHYSIMSGDNNLVSLDEIVKTMLETGKDLNTGYKETSLAGLAKLKKEKLDL